MRPTVPLCARITLVLLPMNSNHPNSAGLQRGHLAASNTPRGDAARQSCDPRSSHDQRWRRARIFLVAIPVLLGSACQNMFTLQEDKDLGLSAYRQLSQEHNMIQSGPVYQRVKNVTDRLVAAAREEDPQVVSAFQWEVSVIQDDETVNAFCLPGGKMAVFTGILPVAEDDTGLAVVMGHEIAHAVERHGTEAMTRQFGAAVLIEILATGTEREWAALGNGLLELRFGRGAELEADRKGLSYMARAGYDPRAAAAFWQRMSDLAGSEPIELLSTHPSNSNRIEQIKRLLPSVIPIYEANKAD